ncbi:MAG: endonuclease/exonuclease/phosphatase family protein [Anaerolineales bacterium]|nr:endonuclease/exonuclease/phosphatase family protein [Anaerolineales bacterium]
MRQSGWVAFILLALVLFLTLSDASAQSEMFCSPGQQPHFSHGFAFLKAQLGAMMGEPLECEHYDPAGNAWQKTTTGQAFYLQNSNTPMFTSGNRRWAWTLAGLQQWTDNEAATVRITPSSQPLTLRVMSYNILFGAGADPGWEQAAAKLSPFAYPGNRLPQILEVIKAAQPDIIGIQEAAGWDKGSPSLAEQVAAELGMNYFLAPTGSGLHVALFTRFKIVEAENLSTRMGNVGALRASLATPNGQPVHVFVVHLDPFSAKTRAAELVTLTQEMSPYLQSPTLLLGDMNFFCLDNPADCQEYQVLSQAGWRLATAGPYKIDQIWASPSLNPPVESLPFPGASFDISDHLPVGAVINLMATR